ncbi:MAG: hypothetical protein CMD12_04885 [Flavobacteriales bacterium]|nr:hypothetical protein [Flavobacteriales bacterium]
MCSNLKYLVIILFGLFYSFAQDKNSIKNILKESGYALDSFYVGGTFGYNALDTNSKIEQLFLSEFNYITPENASKQSRIHPRPGVWQWDRHDKWIDFANKNDLVVRIHGPVSPQASKWAKNDTRTKEELILNMEEYFTELCVRINKEPNVKWMDVVNETVLRNGDWFSEKPGDSSWENPWTQIGLNSDGYPIYIVRAFEIAQKYAPNVKLVYNHNGGMERLMWKKVLETITYLKSKGLRVDGIGWQAHLRNRRGVGLVKKDLDYLSYLIDWSHLNGMGFHVTELNYWLTDENPNSADVLERQAISYQNIVNTLIAKRSSGEITLNHWGLLNKKGPGRYPKNILSIYDKDLNPTKAFYATKKALIEKDPSIIIID